MKQHYLYLNGLQLAYLDNGIYSQPTLSLRCLTILNKYRMKTTSYTTQRALMEQKTAARHVSSKGIKASQDYGKCDYTETYRKVTCQHYLSAAPLPYLI